MLAIYELYLLLFSELIHKPRPCGPSSGPSSFSSHVWTSWICLSGLPNLFLSPSGLFHLLSWRLHNSFCPKWRTNYPYTHTSPWIWQPSEECLPLELANHESLQTLPPVLPRALCPQQSIHRKESSNAGLSLTTLPSHHSPVRIFRPLALTTSIAVSQHFCSWVSPDFGLLGSSLLRPLTMSCISLKESVFTFILWDGLSVAQACLQFSPPASPFQVLASQTCTQANSIFLSLEKFLIIIIYLFYVRSGACMGHSMHMEVRGQLLGVLPLCVTLWL